MPGGNRALGRWTKSSRLIELMLIQAQQGHTYCKGRGIRGLTAGMKPPMQGSQVSLYTVVVYSDIAFTKDRRMQFFCPVNFAGGGAVRDDIIIFLLTVQTLNNNSSNILREI